MHRRQNIFFVSCCHFIILSSFEGIDKITFFGKNLNSAKTPDNLVKIVKPIWHFTKSATFRHLFNFSYSFFCSKFIDFNSLISLSFFEKLRSVLYFRLLLFLCYLIKRNLLKLIVNPGSSFLSCNHCREMQEFFQLTTCCKPT